MRNTLALLLFVSATIIHAQVALIPWPRAVEWRDGAFQLTQVSLVVSPGMENGAAPLEAYLASIGALSNNNNELVRVVHVRRDTLVPAEGYTLDIATEKVTVGARTTAGALHAFRTLQQLELRDAAGARSWPSASIEDAPAIAWRGTMLDVSRHFYSVDFLKRYIEELARLKLNIFHWHLTDDQGWRVEVRKYPKLTEVGAWRTDADTARYGGYYTQEQIKEVVRHASERGVQVVPEIEFPGHCTAALAAYPYLGCRKDTLEVPTRGGVFQDVYCVGQEATWSFMQDVLDELVPLFPSAYFHIGGDEVPKDRWHACPVCHDRMVREGLADEHALQAWSIKRIQRMLQEKDRHLIGWDEILEGGMDKDAVIEVWRGEEQAAKARANGNSMIRTLYFDASPAALKLADVMRFDPSGGHNDPFLMGVECPVWSERIDERNIGYMVFPRLQAFAERLWSVMPPDDLRERLKPHITRLEREGWITATADKDLFNVAVRYDPVQANWLVTTERGRPDISVRFGNMDTAGVTTDSLRTFRTGWLHLAPEWRERELQDERVFQMESHLGLGAKQKLSHPPDPKYGLDPVQGMSDGLLGTDDFHDGLWQGWWGKDPVIALDLGDAEEIEELSIRCLQAVSSWILLPRFVEFQYSDDGQHWRPIRGGDHDVPIEAGGQRVFDFSVKFEHPIHARYVRAILVNAGKLPAWHLGAGGDSWIFADEFVVR
ncbi:MAG: family 20 glycosylhydrolase [Flavobacteriales bacterium]|nr:family 20 glycosylhydrolase [Flavobacteriales bacterium]